MNNTKNNLKYGYCLPGGSFMPQGVAGVSSAIDIMLGGYGVIAGAGFDYGECTVGLLNKLSDAELERTAELTATGELKLLACNSFIPHTMKLAGESANPAETAKYAASVMAKMNKLGVKLLVFGSGGSRSVPDGGDYEKCRAQIMDFLKMCAENGEKYDVTTVIEPLNSSESNILLTSAEAYAMLGELKLPRVKLLIDSYHFNRENEPLDRVVEFAGELRHTHIAEPVCRNRPGYADETYTDGGRYIRAFIAELERAGYVGGVTVESRTLDFKKDVAASAEFLFGGKKDDGAV